VPVQMGIEATNRAVIVTAHDADILDIYHFSRFRSYKTFFPFVSDVHRHLRNIDCLSFVMCRLLAPVLIVNRLLFLFL